MDYPVQLAAQLSQHLRALRKARRMSQSQLGQKLGVSQTRVAAIEKDPSVVSVGQLLEVLQVLNTQLVLRDPSTPPQVGQAASLAPASRFWTPKTRSQGEW